MQESLLVHRLMILHHFDTLFCCRPAKVREGNQHPDPIVETAVLGGIQPPNIMYRHHLQVLSLLLRETFGVLVTVLDHQVVTNVEAMSTETSHV